MSNLFGALGSAGSALAAFQKALDVTQNNVTNANSPGYARQVSSLQSLPFQPDNGLSGGVEALTQSTRNDYAEVAVQQQTSLLGQYTQLQTSLGPLQGVFDVSSSSAIPTALSKLFSSFSAWAAQPSDSSLQAAVISSASQVATAFNQASAQINTIRSNTNTSIQSTVTQINADAAIIQNYNQHIATQQTPDAGLDAQLHNALEDLSNLTNAQVIPGNGGTVTVLLGGQTPLVIGNQVDPVSLKFTTPDSATNPNAPPLASIVDSTGTDVTSQITSGTLGGLLSVRNGLLVSLAGGGDNPGSLNQLAQGVADSVNKVLTAGSTTSTAPYQAGNPLFVYNQDFPSGVAASLTVSSTITPDQLAATDPGPPPVANGTALKLAGLETDPASQINGQGFTQFFGSLVSQVGTAAQAADTGVTAQQSLVAQAKSLRQQLSGVSLDQEAVTLIQLQRSYQAASRVVNVVDQLMESIINMVQ